MEAFNFRIIKLQSLIASKIAVGLDPKTSDMCLVLDNGNTNCFVYK